MPRDVSKKVSQQFPTYLNGKGCEIFSLYLCVLGCWRVRDDEEDVDGLADHDATAVAAVAVAVAVDDSVGGCCCCRRCCCRVAGAAHDGEPPAGALAAVEDHSLGILEAVL